MCMYRKTIIKMFVLPNLLYTFNAIPTKHQQFMFLIIHKLALKYTWSQKKKKKKNS